MACTAIVTFVAQPGRAAEVVAWLRTFHPRLRDFAGFERISVHTDEHAPDVVLEIEHWAEAGQHRAMVASVAEQGGWDGLSALLAAEPSTRYLRAEGGTTASPGVAAMHAPFHGGCACGAVRYTGQALPSLVVRCFCRDCQRASGGDGSVGFAVPRESLAIEGELKRHVSLSASGHDAWRAFCPRCGTPLFAGSSRNQAFIAVKVGSLDDPRACEPTLQLWSESAQPWTCVLPELPAFPRQPG
jgi:quinol monooxygenase YgiN